MSGNIIYTFTINAGGAMASLDNVSQAAGRTARIFQGLSGIVRRMEGSTAVFNSINRGLQSFSDKVDHAIAPGVAFNSSLADLSAVTGISGKGLEEIGGYARDTAKAFGGSAADSVESYKLIVSQLSPEIAKVPEALAAMGEKIAVTSKMMGGDTCAAAEVLTTAMNQFRVSLADPIQAARVMGDMMNTMAAAAKEGSAGLPAIKAALEQAGMAAGSAGISFAETNAAIQVLDKAGKKGSEGGVALCNVMAALEQGRFLPEDVQEELQAAGVNIKSLTDKTLSLSGRLKPLQAVMADEVLITKLFGKENSNAALALLSGLDAMDGYTAAIRGTTTATVRADMIMETFVGKMARQKAWLDDLKISFFNFSGSVVPYLKGTITAFQGVTSVMAGLNAMHCLSQARTAKAIMAATRATVKGTAAMFGHIRATISSIGLMRVYNAVTLASVATTYAFSYAIRAVGRAIYAIPIIGWIAAGISLVVAGFKVLWDKCEGFRRVCFAVYETLKAVFYNIGVVVTAVWENILKPYLVLWGDLAKAFANGIWSAIKWCLDGIVAGFSAVGEFFTGLWDGVMNGVLIVSGFFTGIWNWLTGNCSSVAGFISGTFSAIAQPICDAFAPVWDFVSGLFGRISEVAGKFFGWIGKMWNKLFPGDKFKDLGEAAEKGLAAGSESFRRSASGRGQTGLPAGVNAQVAGATGGISGGAGSPDPFSLNNVVPQTKGSTAYTAIASRLSGIGMPSLPSAADTAGLPLAVAGTSLQSPMLQNAGQVEYGTGQRSVSMERFCDKIEIHIASADGKGHDQIRREVTDVLKQMLEQYS